MKRINLLATAVAIALSAGGALAQSGPMVSAGGPGVSSVRAFWTPARLAAAKPFELKRANYAIARSPSAAKATGPQVSADGGAPTSTGGAVNEFLFNAAVGERAQSDDVAPLATSSHGSHFTTSRVFPDSATVAFPWRAAGKLFFHDPRTNEDFICSASVLRHRVIATAGHCVYHPAAGTANDYFYTQFLFVPAYRRIPPAAAVAPYCSWSTVYRIVAGAWSGSNGGVPNSQDVALMQAADRTCTAGSTLQRLGTVTGYYGYATNALIPQSITQIGYPGNLDSGLRMQVTWAQSFQAVAPNTVTIGSAQRGGSSGGPWLRNFGVNGTDSAHALVGRNHLVSVTSYGPISTTPQYLGGSILNQTFLNMLTTICNRTAGNCS